MTIEIDTSEVEGLADLLAAQHETVGREVRKALTVSINRMHKAAVAAAPVDEGDLRDSIRHDANQGMGRRVYSTEKQGFFQEFGTSNHPPQPWLYPQLEAEAPRFEQAVIDIISELR